MNTPIKLAGFAVGAAAVFAGALGIGAVAGPIDDISSSAEQMADHGADTGSEHGTGEDTEGHEAGSTGAAQLPGGLMVSDDGYTLALEEPAVAASAETPFRFKILGPDGDAVTRYDEEHGKDLHLIVVRRDLVGYQHVHPTLGADGTWGVDLDLSAGGAYRVFADFTPTGGEGLTLGADLSATGSYEPRRLPEPVRTVQVDGYDVTLGGALSPGKSSLLTLSVRKDGKPVTDLEPYLEAYGHLVALRVGDLAYLHVHPDGSPGDGETEPGPDVRFYAEVPSAGSYRLFLDFKHKGEVRTAEFTVRAGEGPPSETAAPDETEHAETEQGDAEHGHGH